MRPWGEGNLLPRRTSGEVHCSGHSPVHAAASDMNGESVRAFSGGFEVHGGRLAVASLLDVVRELLTLADAAEPGTLHGRDVDEHILRAVVGANEAEAFGCVEELDGASRHESSGAGVAPRGSVRGIKLPLGEDPKWRPKGILRTGPKQIR